MRQVGPPFRCSLLPGDSSRQPFYEIFGLKTKGKHDPEQEKSEKKLGRKQNERREGNIEEGNRGVDYERRVQRQIGGQVQSEACSSLRVHSRSWILITIFMQLGIEIVCS